MNKKTSGPHEVLKMLQLMAPAEAQTLLENLKKKDPVLAQFLEQNRITLKDLELLTPQMMQTALTHMSIKDLALALRGAPPSTVQFVLDNVSQNNRKDIQDILKGPPQPKSKVDEATHKIVQTLRDLSAKGSIVLDKSGKDQYV